MRRASANYDKLNEAELTIRIGDQVRILDASPEHRGWWLGQNDRGDKGWVWHEFLTAAGSHHVTTTTPAQIHSPVVAAQGTSRVLKLSPGKVADDLLFDESLMCVVCFGLVATAASLECGHTSCWTCLDQWLQSSGNKRCCPHCRRRVKVGSLRRCIALDNLVNLNPCPCHSHGDHTLCGRGRLQAQEVAMKWDAHQTSEWQARRIKGLELATKNENESREWTLALDDMSSSVRITYPTHIS